MDMFTLYIAEIEVAIFWTKVSVEMKLNTLSVKNYSYIILQ